MINFIRSLISMCVVGLCFIILNVFQILSLVIGIFSMRAMRASLFWLAEQCADFCVWWMTKVYGFRPNVDADPLPPNENAIIIANHQAFADVVVIMYMASLYRRVGHLKFFVKDAIKWIPGPGWSAQFYGSIFLKRNWESDTAKIQKAFANVKDNQLPFWIVSYTEGTRATPAKIAASQKYMQSMGLVPFKRRLCPRTKGIWAATQQLKGQVDAIYDVTIDYHLQKAPYFWSFLSGTLPNFSIRIKRYPIAEVPDTQEAQKLWLIERFREKDHA